METMKESKSVINLIFVVAIAFILAGLPAVAQGQAAAQRNPLAGLERALQAAGAPALSSAEQTSITSLIAQYKPVPASSTVTQALETAILAGTPPDTTAITGNMTTNFQNRVTFASQVAGLLNSNSQLTPLVTKFGTSRVVQLLESILGGGFGAGRGFAMMGLRVR
jgi:hypothetical protein